MLNTIDDMNSMITMVELHVIYHQWCLELKKEISVVRTTVYRLRGASVKFYEMYTEFCSGTTLGNLGACDPNAMDFLISNQISKIRRCTATIFHSYVLTQLADIKSDRVTVDKFIHDIGLGIDATRAEMLKELCDEVHSRFT